MQAAKGVAQARRILPSRRFLVWFLTPAAIGGAIGFAANQLADYWKDVRQEDSAIRISEINSAREIILQDADKIENALPSLEARIVRLSAMRRAFITPDAKGMLTALITDLEILKLEFEKKSEIEIQLKEQAEILAEAERQKNEMTARESQELVRKLAQEKLEAEIREAAIARRIEERQLRLGAY